MTSDDIGGDIAGRRRALGIKTRNKLAEATSLDRGTIKRAELGTASAETYQTIYDFLEAEEAEAGIDSPDPDEDPHDPEPTSEPIRITMRGVYGVAEIIAEGPADHPAEVAEALDRLLTRLSQREHDSE